MGLVLGVGRVAFAQPAGQQVFRFDSWIPAIPLVLAIAALAATLGMALQKKHKNLRFFAIGPLLIALFCGGCCFPTLYQDRVVVTPTRIEQTTGFWFAPSVKGFAYADVRKVVLTDKPQGPKGRVSLAWELHLKSGGIRDIDPGDLWELKTDEIVPLIEQHGVTVERR